MSEKDLGNRKIIPITAGIRVGRPMREATQNTDPINGPDFMKGNFDFWEACQKLLRRQTEDASQNGATITNINPLRSPDPDEGPPAA